MARMLRRAFRGLRVMPFRMARLTLIHAARFESGDGLPLEPAHEQFLDGSQ